MKSYLLVLSSLLLISCNFDVQPVSARIDNLESACDQFNFDITLVTTLGTRKETGSVPAGKAAGVIYATGLASGTNISITGDCIIGSQSVKLTGSYYNPERYLGWTIKITDRNNPKLIPPF